MSIIRRVRPRNIGFSRAPQTLQSNLATNASIFDDFETREDGWFGHTLCTVVEVETDDGVVGTGTARAFSGAAKAVVEQYLADFVIGQNVRHRELLRQRMHRTTVRFGQRRSVGVADLVTVHSD